MDGGAGCGDVEEFGGLVLRASRPLNPETLREERLLAGSLRYEGERLAARIPCYTTEKNKRNSFAVMNLQISLGLSL